MSLFDINVKTRGQRCYYPSSFLYVIQELGFCCIEIIEVFILISYLMCLQKH